MNPPLLLRSGALVAASLVVSVSAGCGLHTTPASDPEGAPTEHDITMPRAGADPALDGSNVRALYEDWAAGHSLRGGDRFIGVRLAALDAASSVPSAAEAIANLDLVDGTIAVQVDGLHIDDADVWLVDNRDGGSALPDVNDDMFRVGPLGLLEHDNQHALETRLPGDLLDTFRVDLVVITEPGGSPVDGALLYGRVPLFNRIYTEERLRQERGLEPRGFVDSDVYVPALNQLDAAVARGFLLFTQETFDGNGRTCATCHAVENNFTIDARYIATLDDDDPLFVHEYNPELADLESPQMLRQLGLVRAPVDGPTAPPVLRGVPSLNAIATSLDVSAGPCANSPIPDVENCGFPPNVGPVDLRGKPVMFGPLARARVREGLALVESVGWSGDGAPHDGSLLNFAVGAIAAHFTRTLNRVAGVDYRVPTAQEADDLLVFQLAVGRRKDVDTDLLTFTDQRVELGRKLYDLNPGGCPDENGVPQCACQLDINGNPCGIPRPDVHNGAGCANCHFKGGAGTELGALSNVANRININFDIGTVVREQPLADAITAEYGEANPVDCGLGTTTPADFEQGEFCHYVTSWHPYSYNARCDGGPQLPAFDCVPGFDPVAQQPICDKNCGGPMQPPCVAWSEDIDNSTHLPGDMYIHGHNPWKFAPYEAGFPTAGLGWYFTEGSWCDSPQASLPYPIITAGMPDGTLLGLPTQQAVCENLAQPLEWSADGGQAFCASDADCDAHDVPPFVDSTCNQGFCSDVPGCKCVDNTSCRGEFFCFRQEGSPIDGYCLGMETPGTPFDPDNADHVARAGNRIMVEPEPVWEAFARFEIDPVTFQPGPGRLPEGIPGARGDACNVFLNGTPAGDAQCFGPQICVGTSSPVLPDGMGGVIPNPDYDPSVGVCGQDPNWVPEVSKFCEVTDTYPNNELPFGCFPGSPDPACQGCIPWDDNLHEAWQDGTHSHTRKAPPGVPPPCWIHAVTPPIESHCGRTQSAETALGYGDGTFTTPPVIESADTAPFFHNNSAATLEDAIAHYATDEFNDSWGPRFPNFPVNLEPVVLSDADVDAIAAYIRQLGAVQNINQAQRALEQAWVHPLSVPGDGRLAFADTELQDALQLLRKSKLHRPARARIRRAREHVTNAFNVEASQGPRALRRARRQMARALHAINEARQLMVEITDSGDSEWTSTYFTPNMRADAAAELTPQDLAEEEATFEQLLEQELDD